MSVEMTPVQRLELSRERMRQALRAPPATPRRASGAKSWRDALRLLPGGEQVAQALARWWARQPWAAVSEGLFEGTNLALQPLARRRPLGLMLGALAVGGVLGRSRPWRWIPKFVLMAGLLPQLLPRGLAAGAGLSWSGLLLSLLRLARRPH